MTLVSRTDMSVSSDKSTAAEKQPRVSVAARSRQATRARLVESGRLLFAKNGLHGVTTHDIAHQAEVASGTFYLHFKNKVEVFQEIADSCVSELIECIDNACSPHRETKDIPALIHAQAEALVGFAEDHRDLIRILFSADADAAAVGSGILRALAETIAEDRRELVSVGLAQNGLDPAVLGQAVVGMWAQVLSWWSEDPTRVSREALIETLTQIQLTGTSRVVA